MTYKSYLHLNSLASGNVFNAEPGVTVKSRGVCDEVEK